MDRHSLAFVGGVTLAEASYMEAAPPISIRFGLLETGGHPSL